MPIVLKPAKTIPKKYRRKAKCLGLTQSGPGQTHRIPLCEQQTCVANGGLPGRLGRPIPMLAFTVMIILSNFKLYVANGHQNMSFPKHHTCTLTNTPWNSFLKNKSKPLTAIYKYVLWPHHELISFLLNAFHFGKHPLMNNLPCNTQLRTLSMRTIPLFHIPAPLLTAFIH